MSDGSSPILRLGVRLCGAIPFLLPAVLCALLVASSATLRAQAPSTADGAPESPLADTPLVVAKVVHRLPVHAVGPDFSLIVDLDGELVPIHLRPLTLPPEESELGARVRRHLEPLVGRRVRFSFRELGPRQGRLGAHAGIGEELLRRGLARYCPSPGVRFPHLESLEAEARAQRRGLWSGEKPALECERPSP